MILSKPISLWSSSPAPALAAENWRRPFPKSIMNTNAACLPVMPNLEFEHRRVVEPARAAAIKGQERGRGNEGIFCGAAIDLGNGTIVTGDNSPQFHAASSLVLHAIKHLAEIPEKIKLLPSNIVDSVRNLKTNVLNEKTLSLDLMEILIALSISATVNPAAQLAMEKLEELHGREVHMTHIPTPGDEAGLRRLGVSLTSDPNFSTKDLFIS